MLMHNINLFVNKLEIQNRRSSAQMRILSATIETDLNIQVFTLLTWFIVILQNFLMNNV